MSVVQPILTLELPILVLILVFWFGQRLGWHEAVGSTAAAGGLAAFLTFANPQGGDEVPNVRTWGIAATAGIAAISISVGFARQGRPAWRAAWFGSSAAISYAFTAAFAKQVTEQIGVQWYAPFLSWQIWGMAVAGLLGIFLTQNAFHAGPVTASQSTLVIVDPLVSLLIGIGLFGDNLQTAGARGPLESLSLIVLFGGVYFLARSPLVATVRSEEEESSTILGSHHHCRQDCSERLMQLLSQRSTRLLSQRSTRLLSPRSTRLLPPRSSRPETARTGPKSRRCCNPLAGPTQ